MMRRLLALLLLAGCASTNWRGVAVGATALDTAVTVALVQSNERQSFREVNPILTSDPKRIVAIQAAILAAVWLLSRDLEPAQRVKLWKWVAALHLGAVAYNVTQGKR